MLVEFAICVPVMLLITCGVCDFARAFNAANTAVGAASSGIEFASIGPHNWSNSAGIQAAALNNTSNYPGATATATTFCTCSVGGTQSACPVSCASGQTQETYVQVTVVVPFNPLFDYPGLPNPMQITQVASARVQ
jgi:Flp pilus assembly protein TadG